MAAGTGGSLVEFLDKVVTGYPPLGSNGYGLGCCKEGGLGMLDLRLRGVCGVLHLSFSMVCASICNNF